MLPFPQKPLRAKKNESEGEQHDVVPERPWRLPGVEGNPIADREMAEEPIGIGESVKSPVRFLGGTFQILLIHAQAIHFAGRVQYAALGFGLWIGYFRRA